MSGTQNLRTAKRGISLVSGNLVDIEESFLLVPRNLACIEGSGSYQGFSLLLRNFDIEESRYRVISLVSGNLPGALTKAPGALMKAPRALTKAPVALIQASVALIQAHRALMKAPGALTKALGALTKASEALTKAPVALMKARGSDL